MRNRVVITGMGVVSPNGIGIKSFEEALRNGRPGIRFIPRLEELKFGCRIGGVPENFEIISQNIFKQQELAYLECGTAPSGK